MFIKAFENNSNNNNSSNDEDDDDDSSVLKDAVRKDAQAVLDRDPACQTLLEVVLFYKGFAALVVHRVAHQKWRKMSGMTMTERGINTSHHHHQQQQPQRRRSMTALFLQSQASAMFGVDIHPGAKLGAGILLDHGTGIVIGETCVVGDGCTLLHGVTLGGTGKDTGDRHPKVGKNVLIGAGASVLGNIHIGDRVKIGAGSIVLRPLPAGATAVGAPAKIIGKTLESNPADTMDESLQHVGHFHPSFPSPMTTSTTSTTTTTTPTGSLTSRSSDHGSSVTETVDETTVATESLSESSDGGGVVVDANHDDSCVCPYRDYAKFIIQIAETLPTVGNDKDGTNNGMCLTFTQFWNQLKFTKCPMTQVVAAFYALDQQSVGYLQVSDMTPDLVTKALLEVTALDSEQIGQFLQNVVS
jgi:serine O-acetyltransferase